MYRNTLLDRSVGVLNHTAIMRQWEDNVDQMSGSQIQLTDLYNEGASERKGGSNDVTQLNFMLFDRGYIAVVQSSLQNNRFRGKYNCAKHGFAELPRQWCRKGHWSWAFSAPSREGPSSASH